MTRVFSAMSVGDEATLQLLKTLLEGEGIACTVRNEQLSTAKGDIPPSECVPELWILDDKDYLTAEKIIDDWREAGTESHAGWLCPCCRETNEGQFTSCWKYGNERECA